MQKRFDFVLKFIYFLRDPSKSNNANEDSILIHLLLYCLNGYPYHIAVCVSAKSDKTIIASIQK